MVAVVEGVQLQLSGKHMLHHCLVPGVPATLMVSKELAAASASNGAHGTMQQWQVTWQERHSSRSLTAS